MGNTPQMLMGRSYEDHNYNVSPLKILIFSTVLLLFPNLQYLKCVNQLFEEIISH